MKKIHSLHSNYTFFPVSDQSDKFTKMKQRKNARKEHVEKKVQTVIVHNDYDLETPYDGERVLLELGEFETDSNKKAKVERKQGKNKTTI